MLIPLAEPASGIRVSAASAELSEPWPTLTAMADISIPDDLLELQKAFEAADQAVRAHVEGATAKHGRNWPEEQEAKLQRLRAEQMIALKAVTQHPAIVAARTGGTYRQLHYALKRAAGAQGWEKAGG